MPRSSGSAVLAVLAAGIGSRFDGPTHKLDARLADGRTLVQTAVDTAIASGAGPVVVILGPGVTSALDQRATVIVNERAIDGQATSLQLAIDAARRHGATQLVVGLGDQPGLTAEAWRRVTATGADCEVAVATYDDRRRRGHPISLAASVWERLPATGDEGARRLLSLGDTPVTGVPCEGSPFDIDTQEDLIQWQNNWSTSSRSTGRSTRRGRR